jgi:tetratricopeptide (TPR) repeat protein/TolB-like protein/tRNA A-37 threonylcarbamoyl transferase component Bud32
VIGRTLSHFRIIDKLGQGGMGVVYRAEDLQLGRQVALKVLHTEFVTDDERRKRFLREARTAASVSHPNIATVHEVGETDGVIFIAMELVEGRTLKRVIHDDRPDVDECLRLAVEIGEGLARAHQANIVHRDLKPENIVIDTDRRVKILDFGLAKLYEDPTGSPVDDSSGLETISAAVTRDGRILGTVQYMSPEQARGVELDARSDVFSLGIVLYELVTGQIPFQGDTITDTLTSILRDEQPPIARFNPEVPLELERILKTCLEKDPARRYQDASAVLADLRTLKRLSDSQPVPLVSDPGVGPIGTSPIPWARVAGLVGIALLLVAIGAGAAALLRGVGWFPGGEPARTALAVIPFENIQERDDPERLGQILQELIITDLSEMSSLKVLSSQRLFDVQKMLGREARSTIDRDMATQVAREAGADVMLTGSLSRLGSRWILTCQLIDLDDGTVLQSDRLDGGDLYAMVDDLTSVVRGDLGLDEVVDVAVTQRTSSSLEAYQAYLAGVDALNALDFAGAIADLERAVEVDPSFGKAYYKLAISRWWKGSLEGYKDGQHAASPADALEALLQGDAKLSRKDRQMARAFLELVEMRPSDAAKVFEEIVGQYPDEKEAWYGLGEALFHGAARWQDRMQALDAFERAIELDPSFSLAFYHVVDLYIQDERFDEGIERVRAFVRQDPENVSWHLDLARLALAKRDDELLESIVEDSLRAIDSRSDQRHFLLGVARSAGKDELELRESLLTRARSIDTDAQQAEVLIGLGWLAVERDDLDRAESLMREAHRLDSHDAAGLNALFGFYTKTRRFDDALREARALVEADPGFAPYYGYWAAAAIRKGDAQQLDQAMDRLDRLMADSDGPGVMLAVGQRLVEAQSQIGDRVAAEQVLRQGMMIEDAAMRATLANELGWNALNQAKLDEAETWFEQALETSLDRQGPLAGLLQASLARGDWEEAITRARQLSDAVPASSGWGAAKLIEAYLRAGDDARARRLIDETLQDNEDDLFRRRFFTLLAEVYLAAGRYEQAERSARDARDIAGPGRDSRIEELLAWSLMNQNRLEEAQAVLEAATAADRTALSPRVLTAYLALVRGEPAEAEHLAGELLARGPVLADAHVVMAYALGQQGRFDEALAHAERVLEMNPNRMHRTLMAWVLIAGEIDLDRGLEMAVRAVETPEAYLDSAKELSCLALAEHCLGLAYLELGRYEQAVRQLTEASRMRPGHDRIREDLDRASRLSMSAGS